MKKLRITIGTGCGLRKDGSLIHHLDRLKMIALVQRHMLATCGGYTMTQATGGWREPVTGKDWEEPSLGFVTIVEPGAVTPEALAALVRDTFEQVCVMLTVEEVNTQFI